MEETSNAPTPSPSLPSQLSHFMRAAFTRLAVTPHELLAPWKEHFLAQERFQSNPELVMQHLYSGMIDLAIEQQQLDTDELMNQVHSVATSFVDEQTSDGSGAAQCLDMCYSLLIEEFQALDGHMNSFLLALLDGCHPDAD